RSAAAHRHRQALRTSGAGRWRRSAAELPWRCRCWSSMRVEPASTRDWSPSRGRYPDMTAASGVSLLEMIIAMALTMSLTAALFSMTRASNAASAVQSEAADIAQRMRVGVDALTRALMHAGAGPYLAGHP